jgi:hypothetical protein
VCRALAVAAPTVQPAAPQPEQTLLKTQPVTLLQLHQFAEHPTPTALLIASAHLQEDLPARLQNLINHVSNFGQSHPLTPELSDASESTVAELSNLQRIWKENGMATATLSEMEDVKALTSALAAHRCGQPDLTCTLCRMGTCQPNRQMPACTLCRMDTCQPNRQMHACTLCRMDTCQPNRQMPAWPLPTVHTRVCLACPPVYSTTSALSQQHASCFL